MGWARLSAVCRVTRAFLYWRGTRTGGAAHRRAARDNSTAGDVYSERPSALDQLSHFVTTPTSAASNAPRGDIIVHVLGRTDVGRTREHNEDAFLVADLTTGTVSEQAEAVTYTLGPRGVLFMVADGLGGAAAGEIASGMAVDIVLQELRRTWVDAPTTDPDTFAHALKKACEAANARIYEYAMKNADHRGLGTTATIAGLLGDTLYLVQVGDSRAYIVRGGVAQQITKDQSLMQRLIEAGELTPEEAEHSERRNIILQALGPEPTVKIDLTHQLVRRGDLLVLCTDGLSGQVRKEEIARVVAQERDLTAAGQTLIDRANENGGPDNITVVIAHVEGAGLLPAGERDVVGHSVFELQNATPSTPRAPVRRITGKMRSIVAPAEEEKAGEEAPASSRTPFSRWNQLLLLALAAALVIALVAFLYVNVRGAVSDASAPPTAPVDTAAGAPVPQ
jgi:PPM family protein phosphatase